MTTISCSTHITQAFINSYTWPVVIIGGTSTNIIKITFDNITLSGGTDRYFICGSNDIQFGSDTLYTDGTTSQITISGITDYPGLIQNAYSYINIFNLKIIASSSTLATGGGWFGQVNYGINNTQGNYIVNCHSVGNINTQGGGIVGQNTANNGGILYIRGCSNNGQINDQAGGIIGTDCATNGGNIYINSCWSEGEIIGDGAGGIVGANSGSTQVINCYSLGTITGNNAGGIIGANAGIIGAIIQNCYASGNIEGGNAGGICGSLFGTLIVSIANCYTTGNLNNSGVQLNGGICGSLFGSSINLTINNCYTTGTVQQATGYFIGNISALSGSGVGYTISTSYSEAGSLGGMPGTWSNTHANTSLTGYASAGIIGSVWISQSNQPYILFNMGYTPYSTKNISSSPDVIRTMSSIVVVGSSTSTGIISGLGYALLEKTGGNADSYGTITINSTTGAINTTTATVPGIYTCYIYNTGSYNITTYNLTIEQELLINVCCQNSICIRNSITTDKSNEIYDNFKSGREITNNVNTYYNNIKTGQATIFMKPVFGSYREYILYLQTKNKYI